jgi:hypothetical protein
MLSRPFDRDALDYEAILDPFGYFLGRALFVARVIDGGTHNLPRFMMLGGFDDAADIGVGSLKA